MTMGACAAASVALVASACLPDLIAAPLGAPQAPTVEPVAVPTCGDGVIDSIENGGATNEDCDPGDGGAVGCTADCRIACDGGVVDTMGHCYFATGLASRYQQAQEDCLEAGAHVVTFASQREVDFIADGGLADGGYWAGLQLLPAVGYVTPRLVDEPGWPSPGTSCPGCFAVGADDAGDFADEDAGSDCVVAGGARWLEHACGGRAPVAVVCEREPIGRRIYFCGGPNCTNLPATIGTKRYVLPTALVTADEAATTCAGFGDGGAIVMPDSAEEREQLVRELVTRFPPPLTVWLGLTVADGHDVWDDGVARPPPWASEEPATNGRAFLAVANPQVTTFDTQLAHVDGDPTARRLVVCQRPSK